MATCRNCGAELPLNARFCPNCAAPVPREPGAEDESPPQAAGRRRGERVAFVVLVLLTVALLALAVLVFVFGVFVEE